MIIVSQDKKSIFNFDNVLGIQIDKHFSNSSMEEDYEIKVMSEKRTCIVGIYKTEERAKEVLEEIQMLYINLELLKLRNMQIKDKLTTQDISKFIRFEMPEE